MAENQICLLNKTLGYLTDIFVGIKHLSWATTLVLQSSDFNHLYLSRNHSHNKAISI